ncbi:MAG TPA: type IV secretion system protein [Steroidobacteraceae bacterium]|nr:type IV secretion system protein [Steroidobacteraceae bacterium]
MSAPRKSMVCTALAAAMLAIAVAPRANAQFAVIDVASIAQLLQQVQLLAQQLAAARAQLLQMQTLYQSMTGSRGMQGLLGNPVPNYLPTDWNSLLLASQGQGAYGALAGGVSSAVAQNAVLSSTQLSLLSTEQQSLITAFRQSSALLQSLAQQSLANASSRFADIQRLSAAIGSTADQKSVLELQAAIGAEQDMLLGEQTKLQILNRAVQAQQASTRERERELVIAGEGSFASRFQPSLP